MAGFDNGVATPGGASFNAPEVSFDWLKNLPNDYFRGVFNQQQRGLNDQSSQLNAQRIEDQKRTLDASKAFPNGLPIDPRTGQVDYAQVASTLAKFGDVSGAMGVMAQSPVPGSPLMGGGQGMPVPGGQPSPAAPRPVLAQPQAQPASVPAPPLRGGNAGDQSGSVIDRVTSAMPNGSDKAGVVATNIARSVGVDPNGTLTPEQAKRVDDRLSAYMQRNNIAARSPSFNDRFAAAGGDGGGNLPPSANAGTPAPRLQAQPPAQPQAAPNGAPSAQPGAPQGQPQQPPQGGPLVPQEPLPPGFTDPRKAIQALRLEADRYDRMPNGQREAQRLDAKADRIEKSITPMRVGNAFLDPQTGRPVAQVSSGGGQAGQLVMLENSERVARGEPPMTAQEEISFIQQIHPPRSAPAMAVEAFRRDFQEKNGRRPTGEEIQEFAAKQAGLSAEERAVGQRAGNIAIAVQETSKTIPNVRALAGKSAGRGTVFWDSIENKWKVQKGDKDFAKYVQQMNSLINLYGRVISGGGKGTVSDAEHAREMLNPNMPLSAVQGSLEGFETEVAIAESAPEEVREKMRRNYSRGKETEAKPAQQPGAGGKQAADGATVYTLPNGSKARVMEVQ